MKLNNKSLLLYAVTDRRWSNNDTFYKLIEESLEGGVTFLQLREKNLDTDSFFKEAIKIKELCKKYNVPFIINDNVEIALKSNADGIHVGQDDMGVKEVRKLIGKDKILGVSVQTVEQALLAQSQGANYLGVGSIFTTTSKDDAKSVSINTLKEICNAVNIPVVAIGGIDKDNVKQLSQTGISGIAVISAIYANKNIKSATMKLKELIKEIIK
ncbi:thiamine phosphate synthase [Thomasclavelia spiroformis]|jgi:thiamine-phosphate pyrophosphorylase|uniref:thiamine phosphate synthase n=1 Tax=Thomasclavelia spiroformis TaxID=29348 RepID=UPI00241D7A5B|nr:thiamine phosphate synthase [Thomasclavelia spiroformis]